jgi:hypothetical protein
MIFGICYKQNMVVDVLVHGDILWGVHEGPRNEIVHSPCTQLTSGRPLGVGRVGSSNT